MRTVFRTLSIAFLVLGFYVFYKELSVQSDSGFELTLPFWFSAGLVGSGSYLFYRFFLRKESVAPSMNGLHSGAIQTDSSEAEDEDDDNDDPEIQAKKNILTWDIVEKYASWDHGESVWMLLFCLRGPNSERSRLTVSDNHKYADDFFFAKVGDEINFTFSVEDLDDTYDNGQSNYLIPKITVGGVAGFLTA